MSLTRYEFLRLLGAGAAPDAQASIPALIPAPHEFRALPYRSAPQRISGEPRWIQADPGAPVDSPEAYRLQIAGGRTTVTTRSEAALRAAHRTLAQLSLDTTPPDCDILDWPDFPLRIAHICYHLIREQLAYNCPNFPALLHHVGELAALKYNAVLLELESIIPYRRHPRIPASIAFTPAQMRELRGRLDDLGMEVIPMVQCLGHAYNVLWHDEYASYREAPGTFQQYCPTNSALPALYMEFVDEYLEFFPHVRQWHMGGDESRQLARCPRCESKADKVGISRLYVDHVAEIAGRLQARGLRPMLWSDMLEHHPEALSSVPPSVRIVYWNYDLPNWPRPYKLDAFRRAGFDVVAAPGVRFGSTGTELSVYYPEALRGIETLIPRARSDGASAVLMTNWMKGSPHENAHYGFAYGADLSWNGSADRRDFQQRYAALAYGYRNPDLCAVYDLLSVKLPYAEPVQSHQPDRLNRFDLSGLRFAEKWARYTDPKAEPAVLEQLRAAAAAAERADGMLRDLAPHCRRGQRQLELLCLSAACIRAKARFGLALHEGRRIEQTGSDAAAWRAGLPPLLNAWREAKQKHRETLASSGFAPSLDFLNELMFERAEYDALLAMRKRIGRR